MSTLESQCVVRRESKHSLHLNGYHFTWIIGNTCIFGIVFSGGSLAEFAAERGPSDISIIRNFFPAVV